jgi:salicylate hydroxylase/6-hydroxynicotinate 3-monooxygenase
MNRARTKVAIIGAGMGGLAAAANLLKNGIDVQVYEQARAFQRVGAGIQQGPNAVKVLRGMGLEQRVRDVAFKPEMTRYREAATGDLLWERPQADAYEAKYGAPQLLLHRADLHDALASAVPEEIIHRSKKLVDFSQDSGGVDMVFADGTHARADGMIAADGVHSFVRERLLGPEKPRFTGRVAYRTTFPANLIKGAEVEGSTKWMAKDRHIVIYYVNPRRDEVYFVTSTPEPGFNVESWSREGDLDELRNEYKDFHPTVRAVLAACPAVHKWALVERDPLPFWTQQRVALLGDACHPMTPYMAQGAGTSIEDAAVLSRCLAGVGPERIAEALKRYEMNRKPRTSWIQKSSSTNDIERFRREQDQVFSYDAWTTPLADEAVELTH